jgi:hypothetical protein
MANIPNSPIVLFGQIDGAPTVSQTYNNPASSHNGVAYYFSINIDIDTQSTMAGDGTFITASSVVAGMWIAEQTGKSWLITNVETVDSNTLTLTIKDVNLHNYFSDSDFNNIYLGYYPTGQEKYMIFSLSEDAIPIIPILVNQYLEALGLRQEWITDVMTRFQYRNLLKSHYNNSDSPNPTYSTYQVGQMVYLDSSGVFRVLDASDAAQVKKRFGVITSVNEPEDGDLGVRPWGKVVGDLDLSSFTVGDALYYDDTVGAPFLTATEPASSAIPMYIKISDTTGMYITDMVGGGGDQIYNSAFDGTGATTIYDVGGVPAGTSVEDLDNDTNTISEILDMIFFPPTCPTPVQPSIGFNDNPDVVNLSITSSYLYLVGHQITSTFSFTANPGSVPGQSNFAGPIVSAILTLPDSTTQNVYSGSAYTMNDYSLVNYEVPLGIQTWEYDVTFGDGLAVLDSYGDPNCPSYSQGIKTQTRKLEGVYPVFAGTSAIYTPGAVLDTWDQTMGPTGNASWSPVALFSFETLSSKQIAQSYGESDTAATWVNHRFAIPNALGLSTIEIDAGQLGWQDAMSSFAVIGDILLDINGVAVSYTIYERVNSDAGGENTYRLNW